jgi:tetratricopeptide (TPR) repeat protein
VSWRCAGGVVLVALELGLTTGVVLAEETKAFPIAANEQLVVDLVDVGHYVKAREVAAQVLAGNPDSFVALWGMAEVYREGEGNLPKARYFAKRAQHVLERRWGTRIAATGPWRWHARVLRQLISISRELDRQTEAVEMLQYRNELYNPELYLEYGWPLMKLGRFDEAREKVSHALASEDPDVRTGALNTLGAMEDELDHPEESYRIFMTLLQEVHDKKLEMDPTYLRNAGEAAWGLGKLDEAEKLLLEATRHFDSGTYSNPWEDLATHYLGEARFPEALSAVKSMHSWLHSCQPAMEQQRWAGTVAVTAALLQEVGYGDEAVVLLRQALARPDRRAGTSVHTDQTEAGHLVQFYDAVSLELQVLAERRSSSGPLDTLALWADSLRLGFERMAARRRAAALIVDHGRIAASLRPTAPDSIDVPDWVRPALNEVLGPGVVATVAERLLVRTTPTGQRERPYIELTLGESLLERGSTGAASRMLADAAASLPRAEVLLRARCAALQGLAAGRSGDRAAEVRHYQEAYARHPAVLRALGVALPTRIASSGGRAAELAASALAGSPRFSRSSYGFALHVTETATGLSATLAGPDGAILREVGVKREQDPKTTARSLCDAVHRQAFAPELDLSQTDIASIEGSTLSGDSMREQLKDLLGK